MNQPDINRVPRASRIPVQTSKRNYWRALFFVLVVCSVVLAAMTSKTLQSENLIPGIAHLPIVRDVAKWTTGIQETINGDDERINVLLLGMPGEGHDGSLLTDSIMFVSYHPKSDHVAMVSIPRDLYVPIPGVGMRKINEANAYGEQNKYPGGGGALAAQTVEKVFDQNIDYFLRIDFAGFERVINLLGGIDVYVERSFVDHQYPTDDFLTETIQFEQGWQHMDGATALAFVRSRHGSNGEGSDFARSARQQKILSAMKNKILSLKILLNPKKIASVIREVSDNIQTNINPWEIGDLLSLANTAQGNNVTTIVLNDAPGGFLVAKNTPETGFILVPRDGNFGDIRELMKNIHTGGELKMENARVYLLNGTKKSGFARSEQQELEKWNINVIGIGNAPESLTATMREKTVIYDLTNGKKETTVRFLKQRYDAHVAKKLPESIRDSDDEMFQINTDQTLADILVVLGNNTQ